MCCTQREAEAVLTISSMLVMYYMLLRSRQRYPVQALVSSAQGVRRQRRRGGCHSLGIPRDSREIVGHLVE